MTYLETYIQSIRNNKQEQLANSLQKTANIVGDKYLNKFDYRTNQIGMLLGNVQSGKTGQLFAIACEAADRGFPFFILLTTDNTRLQQQTFERTEHDLSEFVVCDEKEEQKFKTASSNGKPAILVLKKNTRILREWSNLLKNMQSFRGNPLFIIDDEADAASLNTKVNQNDISVINKYLSEIRNTAIASIYLQVTGTPQALLLQSLNTEWHPNFTYYFEPGAGYLGGDFFFPSLNEVPNHVIFVDNKNLDECMREVIIRHLVVSAQSLLSGYDASNCLLHPGVRQSSHQEIKNELKVALLYLEKHITDDNIINMIKAEYNLISPQKSSKKPFSDLVTKIKSLLQTSDYHILTLNGISTDSSSDYKTGCNFIIGGNTLGRGITFNQLNTFYYIRTSNSPQADTMWQHNRMFGYDRDPGLISLYCTQELYQLFSEINDTNNFIIDQVKRGVKITIAYSNSVKPTRANVLDKSLLNVVLGGSNHFPLQPENHSFEDITEMVEEFKDNEPAVNVSLGFIIKLLSHFKTENSFNLEGYINIIEALFKNKPTTQGRLLVRRNRDITRTTRALLSPNDWSETNQYDDQFSLTLYCVLGQKNKGWEGHPVWVPNIKLPKSKDFYIID
ncbi:helicase [Listeria monocytogenes]|uniref:Z1 domain-containing protein n=1 Tax=Listeria monocytogenes TaxID=1639 RepID=UPI000E727C48|nr:Z1 domain-containing protein [Listeria monocytogenes]EAE2451623.1 helicase [Listeria monocytogenes]EAF2233845.1 helicase [Listeria monocytogenes]EAG3579806.1 helicase [Listeria monocytogenes]EAW7172416.1 helicase [Listeria monocytogenes]EAW7207812.1 helicase [Listeria monocytogenes]